ncbi:MAG: hypothetical protein IJ679_08565 [Lachnospiraceae bacterium]|nr:hypothetical protein [Lachnospiraceae bacterium]
MQDIIKEYGPALITIVSIVAIVSLVAALFNGDEGSTIGKAFNELMTSFFSAAKTKGGF